MDENGLSQVLAQLLQVCDSSFPLHETIQTLYDSHNNRSIPEFLFLDSCIHVLGECAQRPELQEIALFGFQHIVQNTCVWKTTPEDQLSILATSLFSAIKFFILTFDYQECDDAKSQSLLVSALQMVLALHTEKSAYLPPVAFDWQLRICCVILKNIISPKEQLIVALKTSTSQAIKAHIQFHLKPAVTCTRLQSLPAPEKPSEDDEGLAQTLLRFDSHLSTLQSLCAEKTAVSVTEYLLTGLNDFLQSLPIGASILAHVHMQWFLWLRLYPLLDSLLEPENSLVQNFCIQRIVEQIIHRLHEQYAYCASVRPFLNAIFGKLLVLGETHLLLQEAILRRIEETFSDATLLLHLLLPGSSKTPTSLEALSVRMHFCIQQFHIQIQRANSGHTITQWQALRSLLTLIETFSSFSWGLSIGSEELQILQETQFDNIKNSNEVSNESRNKLLEAEQYQNRLNRLLCSASNSFEHDEQEVILNTSKSIEQLEEDEQIMQILATKFYQKLDDLVQKCLLHKCRSVQQVDEKLLQFSSEFVDCNRDRLLISGDGAYVICVHTLLLSFKQNLITCDQFQHNVLSIGRSVFAPSSFLAHLYTQASAKPLLKQIPLFHFIRNRSQCGPLMRFLLDLQLDKNNEYAHLLCDERFLRLDEQGESSSYIAQCTGMKIVCALSHELWTLWRHVLGEMFGSKNTCNQLTTNVWRENKSDCEERSIAFHFMHCLRSLGCLFSYSGQTLFAEHVIRLHIQLLTQQPQIECKWTKFQLHSAYNLLTMGLPVATSTDQCWPSILTTVSTIGAHRLTYMQTHETASNSQLPNMDNKLLQNLIEGAQAVLTKRSTKTPLTEFEHVACVKCGIYSVKRTQISENLKQLLHVIRKPGNCSLKTVPGQTYLHVLDALEEQVQSMFLSIATDTSAPCLVLAIRALVLASGGQLFIHKEDNGLTKTPISSTGSQLLLGRLAHLLPSLVRSGRPLLHLMQVWPIIAEHLLEAAAMENLALSKVAINALNDTLSTWLSTYVELNHFQLHEWLLHSFERLLQQQLCTLNRQPLLLSCLCNFAENHSSELGSGWRSMFGALCALQLQPKEQDTVYEMQRVGQLRILFDTLDAFFRSAYTHVFLGSASHCLRCLLRLLRSANEYTTEDKNFQHETNCVDLTQIALKYLHQFERKLRDIHIHMRLRRVHTHHLLPIRPLKIKTQIREHVQQFLTNQQVSIFVTETEILWFQLLDGLLYCTQSTKNSQVQSKLLQLALVILGSLPESAGVELAVIILRYCALSCAQEWAENIAWTASSQDEAPLLNNFKHFVSIITHLTLQHIERAHSRAEMRTDTPTVTQSDNKTVYIHPCQDLLLHALICFGQLCSVKEASLPVNITCFSCVAHLLLESLAFARNIDGADIEEHLLPESKLFSQRILDIAEAQISILNDLCLQDIHKVLSEFNKFEQALIWLNDKALPEDHIILPTTVNALITKLFPCVQWYQVDVSSIVRHMANENQDTNIALWDLLRHLALIDALLCLIRKIKDFSIFTQNEHAQPLLIAIWKLLLRAQECLQYFHSCSSLNTSLRSGLAMHDHLDVYWLERDCIRLQRQILERRLLLTLSTSLNTESIINDLSTFWCQCVIRLCMNWSIQSSPYGHELFDEFMTLLQKTSSSDVISKIDLLCFESCAQFRDVVDNSLEIDQLQEFNDIINCSLSVQKANYLKNAHIPASNLFSKRYLALLQSECHLISRDCEGQTQFLNNLFDCVRIGSHLLSQLSPQELLFCCPPLLKCLSLISLYSNSMSLQSHFVTLFSHALSCLNDI